MNGLASEPLAGGQPSPFPDADRQPDAEPIAMPIDYARSPVLCMADADLFYAFALTRVSADGVVAPPEYWNHASGGWEPTFDPADHVAPMARLAASGAANGRWQSAAVPWPVATTDAAHMLGYTKDATGAYVEWGFPGGGAAEALAVGVQ